MGEIIHGIDQRLSPEKQQGHNTQVRFTFVRHSQKKTGRVFDPNLGGLVETYISEIGKKRAKQFGAQQLSGRDVQKSYATPMIRTKQTLEAAFEGAGINPQILQQSDTLSAFFSLPGMENSVEFNQRYEEIMKTYRKKYIDKHFPGKKFDELTSDEQEEVAEYAEEPAIEWYLSFGDQRPDPETPSPREHAAKVAFKINRLINLPDYMKDGWSVNLVSGGHKTSTESFLKYVLEREVDGAKIVGFEQLQDIGGSLQILDSWDLEVKNNEQGEKMVTIILHREKGEIQNFKINLDAVRQLAEEYLKYHNKEALKIDKPHV